MQRHCTKIDLLEKIWKWKAEPKMPPKRNASCKNSREHGQHQDTILKVTLKQSVNAVTEIVSNCTCRLLLKLLLKVERGRQ